MFTAPVRGAYNFDWSIGAHANNRNPSAAWLVKNSEHVFIAYEHETAGFMSSSKGATLLLEVGDIVFVRLAGDTRAYDDINHHTTFSGSLLFTM